MGNHNPVLEAISSRNIILYDRDVCDTNLLTTGVLELGTTKGLDSLGLVTIAGAHRHDGLSDTNASHCSLGLAESSSHSSLKP